MEACEDLHGGSTLDDLSDDQLFLMYREGDAEAFETLFDRYRASVYNLAAVMLDGLEGAEEVMQDTFMAVLRAAESYEPRGLFRAWLMRIARNICLSRMRAEKVRRRVIVESGPDVEPAADGPTGAERAEAHEGQAALRRLIAGLPERQREALALYAFEGMSYREIAATLEAPTNTVKTLIHRARANLARALEAEAGGAGDEM